MAPSDIDLYSIGGIKGFVSSLSERERAVIDILGLAMRSPTSPEAMVEAARQLDAMCPSLEEEDAVETYLAEMWFLVCQIAQDCGVSDELRGCLVGIIKALGQQPKDLVYVYPGEEAEWENTPLLDMHLENVSTDPLDVINDQGGKYIPGDLTVWQNVNSFRARLTEVEILAPCYQIVEAMREGLEDDLGIYPGLRECRVQIACDWMQRCADQLLSWAKENIGSLYDFPNGTVFHHKNGRLYSGPPAVCLQRWGFWLQRLEALGGEDSDLPEELRKAAREAAGAMKTAETSVGRAWPSVENPPLMPWRVSPEDVPVRPDADTSVKPVERSSEEPKAREPCEVCGL